MTILAVDEERSLRLDGRQLFVAGEEAQGPANGFVRFGHLDGEFGGVHEVGHGVGVLVQTQDLYGRPSATSRRPCDLHAIDAMVVLDSEGVPRFWSRARSNPIH